MRSQIFRNRAGQINRSDRESGNNQGRGFGRQGGRGYGGGRGGGTKPGSGPGGNCLCPKCGKKVPHVAGQRCIDLTCPDCGTNMIRE
jgi:hypothetical protein